MPFEENIFINCPYDGEYMPLLRPILFCVLYLGYKPRLALESLNSAEARIKKILSLIKSSKYSIHDLSRLKAENAGDLFRLNMPFELGLDMGCREFKGKQWKKKKFLILAKEKFKYQAAISDLSGSDIRTHKNEPAAVVTAVRNWLNNEDKLKAAGATKIWAEFNDFMSDNYDHLKSRGFSKKEIENLEISELVQCMKDWLRRNRSVK